MIKNETQEEELIPISRQKFEVKKLFIELKYNRLATQEQHIIDARPNFWGWLFAPVGVLSLCLGIFGVGNIFYALCLNVVYNFCLALDFRHAEMVLHKDVRKSLKALANKYQGENYEAAYSVAEAEWWRGMYKYSKAAMAALIDLIIAALVLWHLCVSGMIVIGIFAALGISILAVMTVWLMVPLLKRKVVVTATEPTGIYQVNGGSEVITAKE